MMPTSRHPMLAPLGEGELLGHYIVRNARYTGSTTARQAFHEMAKRNPGLYGMLSGIGHFSESIDHALGSIDSLIDEHTELNWYCRGLPAEKFERQRLNIIERINGPVRLCRPEVTLGATDGVERYCPECDIAHLEDFGFAYMHREICAPYVEACRLHGVELRWRGSQGRLFDAGCRHPHTPVQLEIAVEFSRRTAHCLSTKPEVGLYTKADTLRRLQEAGYISSTGRLAVGDTVRDFTDTFSESFSDERMRYMCTSEKCITAALRNLMRPERAVFPIFTILFSWMTEQRIHEQPKTSVSVRPRQRSIAPELSEAEVRSAMANHGTLTAASIALGLNMKKLTGLCLLHGIPVSSRAKTLDPVLLESIQAAYDAKMTPNQVVKRFDVSLSTAHWIRTCRPDLAELKDARVQQRTTEDEAAWEQLLLSNPDKTTTALKRTHYALWARLRRNSPEWLKQHRSTSPTVQPRRNRTWPEPLQPILNEALHMAAGACDKNGKRPAWKTLGRLYRSVGITEGQIRLLHKLAPLTSLLESNASFVSRRLAWANVSFEDMRLWRVARRAGLRESSITRYQRIELVKQCEIVDEEHG